ncbi:CGNR zinc finger domain-containing protein [Fusibacter ferrireducens]|uniref:CGNR zinc finger domain-containing protein n=1 Tax=Fusibacter ferrireducens TaxID=2785058 RepID=A0ABR9ZYM1_9FIRM|nr:CGNR zinc finger domain-containing protein [Fusibacter ferrireducens]MBF4695555.1 CGNR zinc finger domain-containing protein [Fusibacter ferrireducens]
MNNKAIDLANSVWFKNNNQGEILYDQSWFTEHFLTEDSTLEIPLKASFIEQLLTLRTLLLEILSTGEISELQREQLDEYLSKAIYHPKISYKDGIMSSSWFCVSDYENQLLSEIAQDLIRLFSENKIEHVKTCSNDECQYYFIDHSKNKSKKFCSSKCNNLIKMRRYRAK